MIMLRGENNNEVQAQILTRKCGGFDSVCGSGGAIIEFNRTDGLKCDTSLYCSKFVTKSFDVQNY